MPQHANGSRQLSGEAASQARAGLANCGLKIVKAESFCLSKLSNNILSCLVLRLETEEGLVGWGEATAYPVTPVLSWMELLGQALIGSSAWDIERLWTMARDLYTHGSAIQAATSAYDIAFWDLIAKKLSLPVYALLGGKVNDRIRVYHHPWPEGADAECDYLGYTRDLVSQGVVAGKLDPFKSSGFSRQMTSQEIRSAVQTIADIREGGGEDFTLCVEMHGRFNVATALRVADLVAPYAPFFIEEPVPATNVQAMAEVQRGTNLAVALGERLRSSVEFKPYLQASACRLLQPDIGHMGGISGLKRLAHAADDDYVTIAPHCCWGPVHSFAAAHVCSTIPNFLIQEDSHWGSDIFEHTVVGGYTPDPGYLDVPEVPGLGVHLPEEMIQEYACDPRERDIAFIKRKAKGGRRG